MDGEIDPSSHIQVQLRATENDSDKVRRYDPVSKTWSGWIEQGDFISRTRGEAGHKETVKKINEMIRDARERTAEGPVVAPSVERPREEPIAERVDELRTYLAEHPETRRMDLEASATTEGMRRFSLAQQLLQRGQLLEHPRTKALAFPNEGRIAVKGPTPSGTGTGVEANDMRARGLGDIAIASVEQEPQNQRNKGIGQQPGNTTGRPMGQGSFEVVQEVEDAPESAPAATPVTFSVIEQAALTPSPAAGPKEILVPQREWLTRLQLVQDAQTRAPRPVLVQHFKQDTWHPWNECQHRAPVFTNTTLLNELLFDFDTRDWDVVRREGGKLLDFLRAEGVPYILAWSGGKGVHVHVFADLCGVDLDPEVAEGLEARSDYGVDVASTIRRTLFDHLVEKAGVDAEAAKLDPLKVDFSSKRKGSMVRCFGCPRPRGDEFEGGVKTVLDAIPDDRPAPGGVPLRFPESIELWDVAPLASLINGALRAAIKGAGMEAFTAHAVNGSLTSIPCYAHLLAHGAPEGIRNKGAFAVSLFNRVHGRPIEMAKQDVEVYSAACSHSSAELTAEHQGVLGGVYKRDYHGVSCHHIRTDFGAAVCDKRFCPLCVKGGKAKQKDQAEQLIEFGEQGGRSEFFQDERGEPHARVWVKDHYEIMAVQSARFHLWLSREMYRNEGKAPRVEAVKAALNELSARGVFSGKRYALSLRVAEHDGAIWIDLCDDKWRAIRVTADGYQIVNEPPILFRRYKHMLPLDEPKASDGTALRQLVNLANLSEIDRRHLMIQLVVDLVPGILHPGQYVSGGQGSGKTWIGRIEKMIIDPAINVSNSMPKKIESLELLLDHNYIVCLGNLTYISNEVSDLLSCAITGDARASRTLYTDGDESFKLYRSILRMDGIANAVRLPDLMDRLIYRYPPKIERGAYIEDKEMEARILELRPYVLHELLGLLAEAMRRHPAVERPGWTPRMSGWYKWALAAAEALGMDASGFEESFKPYIDRQDSEALDGDMLAVALVHLSKTGFLGTSTDLWGRLNDAELLVECRVDIRDPSWPKSAKAMSKRISIISSNLEAAGAFLQRDITYSEARTRFGDAIFRIPRGRVEDYIKQDRIIILTKKRLEPIARAAPDRLTQQGTGSTLEEHAEKGICCSPGESPR